MSSGQLPDAQLPTQGSLTTPFPSQRTSERPLLGQRTAKRNVNKGLWWKDWSSDLFGKLVMNLEVSWQNNVLYYFAMPMLYVAATAQFVPDGRSLICRLPAQSSSWEPKKRTVHVSRSYKCRPVHLPQLVFQSMHDHARCQLSILSMANFPYHFLWSSTGMQKEQLSRFTSLCV